MKLSIKVTQEHIDRGIRHEATMCPLAHAIKDHYHQKGEHVEVAVGDSQIALIIDGTTLNAEPSYAQQLFIYWFDDGYPVKPEKFDFNFKLEENF